MRSIKHAGVVVLTLLLVAGGGGCQSGKHFTNGSNGVEKESGPDAKQAIPALLQEYTDALLKKDYDKLDRIWSDDLTFVNPRGQLLTKAQRLANLRSGATAFKSIDLSQTTVRAYGDNAAAVAVSLVKLEAQYSGQEGSGTYRVTTAWARPHGPWQMVAVHMTRVEQ